MYNEKMVSLEESNLIATISTCTMKKWPSKRGQERPPLFEGHLFIVHVDIVAIKLPSSRETTPL
jgi:hypothetical protein